MTSEPLSRCRKCGGEPMMQNQPYYFWGPDNWRMLCSVCGYRTGLSPIHKTVIQEWKKMNQPDDNEWVTITDPNHIIRSCDRIVVGEGKLREPVDSHGDIIGNYLGLQFRCRRKDLPPQAEPVKPVHPMCAAMADAAFVPLMHEQENGTIGTKSGEVVLNFGGDGKLYAMKGAILDNGDNPNCGLGKPVERATETQQSIIEPHQLRVVDEKRFLDVKIEKLMQFLTTAQFDGLDNGEQSRLRIQLSAMQTYSTALGERIAHFG